MNYEEQQEYQEKMGSPEMEYLQYMSEHPELQKEEQITKISHKCPYYENNCLDEDHRPKPELFSEPGFYEHTCLSCRI
jgi:hypothetical protein